MKVTTALDGEDSFDPLSLSDDEGSDKEKTQVELGKNIEDWVNWRPRNRHERVLLKGLLKPLRKKNDDSSETEGSLDVLSP